MFVVWLKFEIQIYYPGEPGDFFSLLYHRALENAFGFIAASRGSEMFCFQHKNGNLEWYLTRTILKSPQERSSRTRVVEARVLSN